MKCQNIKTRLVKGSGRNRTTAEVAHQFLRCKDSFVLRIENQRSVICYYAITLDGILTKPEIQDKCLLYLIKAIFEGAWANHCIIGS